MRKIYTYLLIISSLIFATIPYVSAIDSEGSLLPDNVFYGIFTKLPEKIEMAFTFDDSLKLQKNVIIVEKRTKEINKLPNTKRDLKIEIIKEKLANLQEVNRLINKGAITSEKIRSEISERLKRINESEQDDLEDLPIVIPDPEKRLICGGIQGAQCPEGMRCTCDFSQDCKFDQLGTCTQSSNDKTDEIINIIFCPMIYQPVCGDDDKTYSNSCIARQRGITNFINGKCPERTTPIPTQCASDNECQAQSKSCYTKCINGKCNEIMTFVKLPDYPYCEGLEHTLIPVSQVIPEPAPILCTYQEYAEGFKSINYPVEEDFELQYKCQSAQKQLVFIRDNLKSLTGIDQVLCFPKCVEINNI